MTYTEIFTTFSKAKHQAKIDLAKLLKVKDVPVTVYNGQYAPHSARCSCGETAAYQFQPAKNAQLKKMMDKNIFGYTYGVCECCGK